MSIQKQTSVIVRSILAFLLVGGLLGAGFVDHALAAPGIVSDIVSDGSDLLLNGNFDDPSFPSTSVLDDFNRANGAIGSNWAGGTAGYAISGSKMDVNSGGDIYWTPSHLGIDQEAYVTLTTIDTNANQISLNLKVQSNSSMDPPRIGVVYNPPGNYVQIWTYSITQDWVEQGTPIPVTYENGNLFGVRARANGQVEVYKNSTLVGARSITSWPYYAHGGYIGLFHLSAGNTVLDNFGGGTMRGSPTLTPPPTCTDPTTCNPVQSIPALWKCNIPECTSGNWSGGVVAWPSWSAYQNNARTGDNSRSVYTYGNQPLYPYMGSWADGCQVTAVTGVTLIIEWKRGTDVWDETVLEPGQSHTIDLVSPQDGALIESRDGSPPSFSVSLANCTPQNIFEPTSTPTNTATPTPTDTPTATSTPTDTPTATSTPTDTPTATSTPSPTPTSTSTPTETSTPSSTPTSTVTPTATPTIIPVTSGPDTTGVFRPSNGLLYLKNRNDTGFADMALNYGLPGDYPVVGDWDGNGTVTIGIYRNGTFYLRNSNTLGFADLVFAFGVAGDQPIAGDWNGDGVDTIGVYRPSHGLFLLRNSNTAGDAEMSFYLGNVGDVGIAGDWNNDGIDTTGVFRPSNGFIFLKNINSTGFADIALNYGLPGDKPVTGDWDNNGTDTIGVYRSNTFYLRNSNTIGFADLVFSLGNPGDMPIAGDWDGLP